MTKSWDDVREDICELYNTKGKSLREIQRIMLSQRGFKASTRAYRLKLKEWKARRDDKRAIGTELSVDLDKSPSYHGHYNDPSEVVESHGQNSTLPVNSISTVPIGGMPGILCPDPQGQLSLPSLSSRPFQLSTSHFIEGKDSILHQIARRYSTADKRILNIIIRFMKAEKISMDLRNHQGSTALEDAIRSDEVDMAHGLLRCGASPHSLNAHGEQPLHVALGSDISQKSKICGLLLSHGADSHFRSVPQETVQGETPVQVLLNRVASSATNINKAADYKLLKAWLNRERGHDLLYDAFSNDAEFNPEIGCALRKFIRGLSGASEFRVKGSSSAAIDADAVLDCLGDLLKRGFDPFVDESAGLYCPMGICREFAPLAVFHSTGDTYCNVVLAHSSDQYASKLVRMLLNPCKARMFSQWEVSLPIQLARFFAKPSPPDKPQRINGSQDFLSHLLCQCSDSDREKPQLLQALLESGKIDVHQPDSAGSRPLEHLMKVSKPLRWELAEMIFSKEVLIANSCSCENPYEKPQIRSTSPMYYILYSAATYKWYLKHYLTDTCTDTQPFALCDCLLNLSDSVDVEYGNWSELYRCILHVVTKLVADSKMELMENTSRMDQLRKALKWRLEYEMPMISIDPADILYLCDAAHADGRRSVASLAE